MRGRFSPKQQSFSISRVQKPGVENSCCFLIICDLHRRLAYTAQKNQLMLRRRFRLVMVNFLRGVTLRFSQRLTGDETGAVCGRAGISQVVITFDDFLIRLFVFFVCHMVYLTICYADSASFMSFYVQCVPNIQEHTARHRKNTGTSQIFHISTTIAPQFFPTITNIK